MGTAGPHRRGRGRAIIALGDHSPIEVIRGSEPVFALAPLTDPPALPDGAGPALLLAARHELVPYVGRDDARAEAAAWLAGNRVRAVRLLTAPGGQGKTRFAVQVAREAVRAGWQVFLAQHTLDGELLAVDTDVEPVAVAEDPVGVLVVVDYADRWAHMDLLTLLTRPQTSGARLRVLLLGRSDVSWPTLARTLNRAGIDTSHRSLPSLAVGADQRGQMFDTAVSRFAAHRAAGGPVDSALVERPDLSAEGYQLTLAVQMAALAAVLRSGSTVPAQEQEPGGGRWRTRPRCPENCLCARSTTGASFGNAAPTR